MKRQLITWFDEESGETYMVNVYTSAQRLSFSISQWDHNANAMCSESGPDFTRHFDPEYLNIKAGLEV